MNDVPSEPISTSQLKISYPRISIVIPSYNQGAYLEQAIRSVLLQDYPHFELIVIDGGSRDESMAILQKYSPWLAYWISEPDRGQSHAINKGFAHCQGDILTFLSSDDYYLPGVFADVTEKFVENPLVGAIIGGVSFLDAVASFPDKPIIPYLRKSAPVDLSLGPPDSYRLHQVATFYTRYALETVGLKVREDMHYVMDRELLYRVCRTFPVRLSERPYGVFRRHEDSKSSSVILPFAQEFAQLYTLSLTGNSKEDRDRHKMAQYRLSRGYVKYASAVKSLPEKVTALIQAVRYQPTLLAQRSYWLHWRRLLRFGQK